MLDTLGHREAARAVEEAVVESIRQGVRTADLGGTAATAQVGDWLAETVGGRTGANL